MRLQDYLDKQKVTQTDFARRLGTLRGWAVHVSAVNRWCRGARPSRSTARDIAAATGGKVTLADWRAK